MSLPKAGSERRLQVRPEPRIRTHGLAVQGRQPLSPDDSECASLVSNDCRSQGSIVHRAAIKPSIPRKMPGTPRSPRTRSSSESSRCPRRAGRAMRFRPCANASSWTRPALSPLMWAANVPQGRTGARGLCPLRVKHHLRRGRPAALRIRRCIRAVGYNGWCCACPTGYGPVEYADESAMTQKSGQGATYDHA